MRCSASTIVSSQPYVGRVLPAVLDGLADENEGVREAALAAGRTLVELYAATSQQLLLPAVETGIVDDNWRIRHSSVELLGDLLFKVRAKMDDVQIPDLARRPQCTSAPSYHTSARIVVVVFLPCMLSNLRHANTKSLHRLLARVVGSRWTPHTTRTRASAQKPMRRQSLLRWAQIDAIRCLPAST